MAPSESGRPGLADGEPGAAEAVAVAAAGFWLESSMEDTAVLVLIKCAGDVKETVREGPDFTVTYFELPKSSANFGIYEGGHPSALEHFK